MDFEIIKKNVSFDSLTSDFNGKWEDYNAPLHRETRRFRELLKENGYDAYHTQALIPATAFRSALRKGRWGRGDQWINCHYRPEYIEDDLEDDQFDYIAFWSNSLLPEVKVIETGEVKIAPPDSVVVFNKTKCVHQALPDTVQERILIIRAWASAGVEDLL
jgi:hypothetical protein